MAHLEDTIDAMAEEIAALKADCAELERIRAALTAALEKHHADIQPGYYCVLCHLDAAGGA